MAMTVFDLIQRPGRIAVNPHLPFAPGCLRR
jgi:hypothetical protein